MTTALTRGLVGDRVRVLAGVLALLAAVAGTASLVGRAVWFGEASPLLVAARLLAPALLAWGGHLAARRDDGRGIVLLATLALLLAPGLVSDARMLSRAGDLPPVVVGGLVQSVLGVLAGTVAWTRRLRVPRTSSVVGTAEPAVRTALVGGVVVLALAELYPSVAGPLVGALQPLLVVLGATAWPTLLAALGTALVAVLAARAEPAAAAVALGALAAVTLGQVVLQLEDVFAERVAATVWLWLRLLAAVVVAGVAGHLAGRARREA